MRIIGHTELESWLLSDAMIFWILEMMPHRAEEIIPKLEALIEANPYQPGGFGWSVKISKQLTIGIDSRAWQFWAKSDGYTVYSKEVSLKNFRQGDYPMPRFSTKSVANLLRLKGISRPMTEAQENVRQARMLISFGLSSGQIYEVLQCGLSPEIEAAIAEELVSNPQKSLYRRCLEDGDVHAGIELLKQLETV